jgi:hypothetical protein
VTEPALLHRWSFDEASTNTIDIDSIGGANGTNESGAVISNNAVYLGGPGTGSFVAAVLRNLAESVIRNDDGF